MGNRKKIKKSENKFGRYITIVVYLIIEINEGFDNQTSHMTTLTNTENTSIEITKAEAIARITADEKFYNVDIETKDGSFQTATSDNIDQAVRFWLVK